MANQTPPKGFWASIADTLGIGQSPEERQRRRDERSEEMFKGLAALFVMGDGLPDDIAKELGPKGKVKLANSLLEPGSLEEKLATLKREQAQMREQERKASEPVPPEEQYRREAERAAQQHFGRQAAYQAEGQRRIAEFLKERSAGLSADEIRREIQNINDWVQRQIDEL